MTVLLSFEEKQMTLACAHNRDIVPLIMYMYDYFEPE